MRHSNLLFTLALFFLISCNNDDEETTPPPFQASEIEFIEIWQGQGSGGWDIPAMNLVINEDEEWQALLDSTGLQGNNVIAEAEIDFNTHTVIAVFLEVKPTGWFVEITSITQYENRIEVIMEDLQDVTQEVTQPYHIVKIPATDDDFVFQLSE